MGFKVIDASVLLHARIAFDRQAYLAPNSVLLEVHDERVKELVDASLRSKRLRVADPGRAAVQKVVCAASETGDIASLSPADLDVLALALEKKAVVVSDDYAIQNTARRLGLTVETGAQDGIKEVVTWVNVCEGCGRTYSVSKKALCSVCGSHLLKKPFKKA
jgi:UPF0271 protein